MAKPNLNETKKFKFKFRKEKKKKERAVRGGRQDSVVMTSVNSLSST
jgi:hypothetical protein